MNDSLINFEIDDSEKAGALTLEGGIGIEQAEGLKAALVSALGSVDRVMVDVEKLTAAGLPCFELLCSAHRTALSMGKELELSAPPPDPFTQTVRDSGYGRCKGCTPETHDSCLWLHETPQEIDRKRK